MSNAPQAAHGEQVEAEAEAMSPRRASSRRSQLQPLKIDRRSTSAVGFMAKDHPDEQGVTEERPGIVPQSPSVVPSDDMSKRVQRLVGDVNDLKREWEKNRTEFTGEREMIKDHITSFEAVVVNQVQSISQHTSQVFNENRAEVKKEIDNRKKDMGEILEVMNTLKLSVDRESFERMEQQEKVCVDIQATCQKIEEVKADFVAQLRAQAVNIEAMLNALESVKKALGQEQHERLEKYEQVDYTLEQFLGMKAVMEAELKEHQKDAKELLSMMNAMSKKQDLDAYERIMYEEQVRSWFAETSEKVQAIEQGIPSDSSLETRPDGLEGVAVTLACAAEEFPRRRRPSKDFKFDEERRGSTGGAELKRTASGSSSLSSTPTLTGVSRQLTEERQARLSAIQDVQTRCDAMSQTFNARIKRLEDIPSELALQWKEILAEERKQWKESVASTEPVLDIPQLERRWCEMLAEERKQWSQSSASTEALRDIPQLEGRWQEILAEERKQWKESGDVTQLEGRIARLEAALERKAAAGGGAGADDADLAVLSSRVDALAGELQDMLDAHNRRLSELADEGQVTKQELVSEAKIVSNAVEAASQATLALEKRLLGLQQGVDQEFQSLREAVGNLRRSTAENQRTPEETSRQLGQQAPSVDEDRLRAVQVRFEEELERRTSELEKKLANIDSQLVGQREAGEQDGGDREKYAILQQSLDSLLSSIAAHGGQSPSQQEVDDSVEKVSVSSVDEVDGQARKVSKTEFNSQTQFLWSAVKQLQQQHIEEQRNSLQTDKSTAASTASVVSERRSLPVVTSVLPGVSGGLARSASGPVTAVTKAPSAYIIPPPQRSAPAISSPAAPVASARQRSVDSPSPWRQQTPTNATAFSPCGNSSTTVYRTAAGSVGYAGTPRATTRVLSTSSPVTVSRSLSAQR